MTQTNPTSNEKKGQIKTLFISPEETEHLNLRKASTVAADLLLKNDHWYAEFKYELSPEKKGVAIIASISRAKLNVRDTAKVTGVLPGYSDCICYCRIEPH